MKWADGTRSTRREGVPVEIGVTRRMREDMRDGVAALGPPWLVFLVGAAAGVSLLLLWLPLWFVAPASSEAAR